MVFGRNLKKLRVKALICSKLVPITYVGSEKPINVPVNTIEKWSDYLEFGLCQRSLVRIVASRSRWGIIHIVA